MWEGKKIDSNASNRQDGKWRVVRRDLACTTRVARGMYYPLRCCYVAPLVVRCIIRAIKVKSIARGERWTGTVIAEG